MSDEEDYDRREEDEEQEEEAQEEEEAPEEPEGDEGGEEPGYEIYHGAPPHGYPAPHPPSGHVGPRQYDETHAHYEPQPRKAGEPYWEYSDCSGNRKALLVGINYTGTDGQLNGCHSDVDRMSKFLIEKYQFEPGNMRVLKDDPRLPEEDQPTRANILEAMEWLVDGAQKNDSLFFHYSGHGGHTDDEDGDEKDGQDESIYPIDHEQAGMIVDDDMHRVMVAPLQAGTRLTAVYDSCHSGSVLDLPFTYTTSGDVKDPVISQVGKKSLMDAGMRLLRGDTEGALAGLAAFGQLTMNEKKAHEKTVQEKQSAADVVMMSGCKDDQTSADATEDNVPTGALSWAFMTTINEYPEITYSQLLNTIRDKLKEKQYSQKPQLSSSHPMDLNLVFVA